MGEYWRSTAWPVRTAPQGCSDKAYQHCQRRKRIRGSPQPEETHDRMPAEKRLLLRHRHRPCRHFPQLQATLLRSRQGQEEETVIPRKKAGKKIRIAWPA